MSSPRDAGAAGFGSPLRPSRRSAPEPAAPVDETSDLERGRTVALLAVLGRVQLRLDQLAKNQSDFHAETLAGLARIEARLTALEGRPAAEATAPAPTAPWDQT